MKNQKPSCRARAIVLGGPVLALLFTLHVLLGGGGAGFLPEIWFLAVLWTFFAAIAGALWRAYRGDRSAFAGYELPKGTAIASTGRHGRVATPGAGNTRKEGSTPMTTIPVTDPSPDRRNTRSRFLSSSPVRTRVSSHPAQAPRSARCRRVFRPAIRRRAGLLPQHVPRRVCRSPPRFQDDPPRFAPPSLPCGPLVRLRGCRVRSRSPRAHARPVHRRRSARERVHAPLPTSPPGGSRSPGASFAQPSLACS